MKLNKYKLSKLNNEYYLILETFVQEDEYFILGNDILCNGSLLTDEICKSIQYKIIGSTDKGYDKYFNKLELEEELFNKIISANYTFEDIKNSIIYGNLMYQSGIKIATKKGMKLTDLTNHFILSLHKNVWDVLYINDTIIFDYDIIDNKYIIDKSVIVNQNDWCFEMYNGISHAINPITYIDKSNNKWYLREMNMNCAKYDKECNKIVGTIYPIELEDLPVFTIEE